VCSNEKCGSDISLVILEKRLAMMMLFKAQGFLVEVKIILGVEREVKFICTQFVMDLAQ